MYKRQFVADVATVAPKVRFWGQVRPGTSHAVLLQRGSPKGGWKTVRRVRTDARGAFLVTLSVPARGARYRYRTTGQVSVDVTGTRTLAPLVSDVVKVVPLRAAKGRR